MPSNKGSFLEKAIPAVLSGGAGGAVLGSLLVGTAGASGVLLGALGGAILTLILEFQSQSKRNGNGQH